MSRRPGEDRGAALGGADTRDMLVVHDALRGEYALMPDLVRGVPVGDRRRAAVVAAHVALISDLLEHHHQSEDRVLWPLLMARTAADPDGLVELMERQHAAIHHAQDHVATALARWRRHVGRSEREALAEAIAEVASALTEHLAAEEQHLLPLAGAHLTQAEWGRLGEEGMAGLPKRQLPLVLGTLMYRGDPAVIAVMLQHVPVVPRLLLPWLAPRVHARYARRVHGTATP